MAGRVLRGTVARAADTVRASWARGRGARDRLLLPGTDDPGEHWLRIPLNRSIDEYLRGLGPPAMRAVEISGRSHAARPWREYTRLEYPEFDLCAPMANHGTFDVVICEQVIEHVVDPCAAVSNLCGLCRPGGHVVVSTPFLVRVHELPEWGLLDYWRFTPRGMSALLERSGLEVEAVHSWGNRRVILGNFDRWAAYRRWHSLRSEPDLPVQVWAFARRPQQIPVDP